MADVSVIQSIPPNNNQPLGSNNEDNELFSEMELEMKTEEEYKPAVTDDLQSELGSVLAVAML